MSRLSPAPTWFLTFLLAAGCGTAPGSVDTPAPAEDTGMLPLPDDTGPPQADGGGDAGDQRDDSAPSPDAETGVDPDAAPAGPCLRDTDCPGRTCLNLDGSPDGGICVEFCGSAEDCAPGESCLTFVNTGGDARRVCVPENLCFDADGDGFGTGPGCLGRDCDDTSAEINPRAPEVCDGLDNDCDGDIDNNPVGDGVPCETGFPGVCANGLTECVTGTLLCTPTAPGPEVCDGLDNDCDGEVDNNPVDPPTWYRDQDGDRFGRDDDTIRQCNAPEGYVAAGGDCNDDNPDIRPGITEICNGIDDNCNGEIDELPAIGTLVFYRDRDRDGYGVASEPLNACAAPDGWALLGGDCNDDNPGINPGQTEICNGIDDNCNGEIDEGVLLSWWPDRDGDTWGDNLTAPTLRCTRPDGFVNRSGDCNDWTTYVRPGAPELCDGIDNDCDGAANDNCANGCRGFPRNATAGNPAIRGYTFCQLGSGDRTRNAQRARCHNGVPSEERMDLVSIETADENTWIVNTSRAAFGDWARGWIGGDRVGAQWTWVATGALVGGPLVWSQWGPGLREPSGDGPCMEIYGSGRDGPQYAWNDIGCGNDLNEAFCEWVRPNAAP